MTTPTIASPEAADLPRMKRLGWAIRAVFALGIGASLAGNVLHAEDNPISQAIAAWSPLSLLLAVELISRVPVRRGVDSFARLAATAVIAGIAAWVSYWHMVGVAVRYGETGPSPYLIPFSVDGLIVIASISLVEIGGRIRRLTTVPAAAPQTTPDAEPVAKPDAEPVAKPDPEPVATPDPPAKPDPMAQPRPVRVRPRPASADVVAKVAAKMPGASTKEIAERAGVSPSTVRRRLAALRVSDASPSDPVPAETRVLTAV